MKNQYFGDINDYRKYGLSSHTFRIMGNFASALCWMLTAPDSRTDGKFIDYVGKRSIALMIANFLMLSRRVCLIVVGDDALVLLMNGR